jgi:hypothetical protein
LLLRRFHEARLLLVVLILLIPVRDYVAQENHDPKQAELAIWARLKTMTQTHFKQLATRAQSTDPEAQYWVGRMYEEGFATVQKAAALVGHLFEVRCLSRGLEGYPSPHD